ncbi:dipeptidase [Virgibacillus byunsanensis]|uniref:Dipeptidase n=1 Tax=Virgibacillus byunsanensis TaxID=570945 RepID=A0ABW3LS24_9BACI
MKIVDTHCDALLRLQLAKNGEYYNAKPLNYRDSEQLGTSLHQLQTGNVLTQFFAIFIYPEVPSDQKWQHALEQIDLFYTEVLGKNPEMKHITKWEDFSDLKEGEIGAVLTLEGADAFGNDLAKLRHLYRLGVLSIGMTWNHANLCADGAKEPRGGGLTLLGKDVVKLNNQHHVFTDVSHSTVAGFWDILELSDYPMASHSNARAICDHPRNLYDDQIKAMFAENGLIQVVFNPPFINEESREATIPDLIKHIDHLCALGGRKQIGFGSDFDGISSFVENLEHASKYQNLINELLKYYTEDEVKGFSHQNFLNHLPK